MAVWQSALESMVMRPDAYFWHGKRVLVTGHSGFKGAWLALWLKSLGASVTGLSLAPVTQPNLPSLLGADAWAPEQQCDIRNPIELKQRLVDARPDIVFHLAAQALVRASYADPLGTFATNVMGTANVLEAVRACPTVRAVVVVTTDKVYRNRETPCPYREDDVLGGDDPYSASKAATELVVDCFRTSFLIANNVALATARAGNVVGGGDWSEDRLVPDAVRAWGSDRALEIRRPDAFRPWQHVLEPLSAYLTLAQAIWEKPALAGAYNFGPATEQAASVREVVQWAKRSYPEAQVVWGDGDLGPKEAGLLMLESSKARFLLGIKPRWTVEDAISRSMLWYRQLALGRSAYDLCMADIAAYELP